MEILAGGVTRHLCDKRGLYLIEDVAEALEALMIKNILYFWACGVF